MLCQIDQSTKIFSAASLIHKFPRKTMEGWMDDHVETHNKEAIETASTCSIHVDIAVRDLRDPKGFVRK